MNTLIIGYGEIGQALEKIFSKYYKTEIVDKYQNIDFEGTADIIHIAFPYSKNFISEVKAYQKKYKPKYTVIHSTVPVGTSRKCKAVHSPVVGVHPYLEESIKTFTKFLGGENASEVADYFRRANIKVYPTDKSETTELTKILCTTFYGVCIEYFKDVKRLCRKNGIPFEFWTLWTDNYNEGYKKLGQEQYARPNLIPILKKISGHCVMPNTELVETPFTKLLKELNK